MNRKNGIPYIFIVVIIFFSYLQLSITYIISDNRIICLLGKCEKPIPKLMKKVYLVLLVSIITACTSVNYVAPSQYDDVELSKVINTDFDDTWTSIIDYASSSFFGIDTFEKSSGLITLTFGTQNPELYADCGDFTASGLVSFDGKYMEWIALNDGNLMGRMNITARAINEQETQIRVNAGYVITFPTDQRIVTWNFNSGGSDTQRFYSGNWIERTCVSTGEAERLIIQAIDEIATN